MGKLYGKASFDQLAFTCMNTDIICDCLCENPPCYHILHSFMLMNVKHPYIHLSSFALHQKVARSFSHYSAKFCSIPLSSYRVIRFQTSKNRPKFACWHGGFSQRQSHIKNDLISFLIISVTNFAITTRLR